MAAWVDQLMSQAIASQNPETQIAREYIGQQTKSMAVDLQTRRADAVASISTLLAKAKDEEAPPAVLNAYEKLLANVTDV